MAHDRRDPLLAARVPFTIDLNEGGLGLRFDGFFLGRMVEGMNLSQKKLRRRRKKDEKEEEEGGGGVR